MEDDDEISLGGEQLEFHLWKLKNMDFYGGNIRWILGGLAHMVFVLGRTSPLHYHFGGTR